MKIDSKWSLYLNLSEQKGYLIISVDDTINNTGRDSIYIELSFDKDINYFNVDKHSSLSIYHLPDEFDDVLMDFLMERLFIINVEKEPTFTVNSSIEIHNFKIEEEYEYISSKPKPDNNLLKDKSSNYINIEKTIIKDNNIGKYIDENFIYDKNGNINVRYINKILKGIFDKVLNKEELMKLPSELKDIYIKISGNMFLNKNVVLHEVKNDINFLSEKPETVRNILKYLFKHVDKKDTEINFEHSLRFKNSKLGTIYNLNDDRFILTEYKSPSDIVYRFKYDSSDNKMIINIYPNHKPVIKDVYEKIIKDIGFSKYNVLQNMRLYKAVDYLFNLAKYIHSLNKDIKNMFKDIKEFLKKDIGFFILDTDIKNDKVLDTYNKVIDSMNIKDFKNKEVNGNIGKLSKEDINKLHNEVIDTYKYLLNETMKKICK